MYLLIIAGARGAANLFWQVYDPQNTAFPVMNGSAAASLSPSPVRADASLPVPPHIFGKAAIEPVEDETADTVAATDLNLTLNGVIAAQAPNQSLAIITVLKDKNDKQAADMLYGVGDIIIPQVVIRQILADRVILDRNGSMEALFLGTGKRPGQRGGIHPIGDGVHWQMDGKFLDRQLADLSSLSRQFDLRPYVKGGRQQGFRLAANEGSPLLRRLGLRPGDIIYEINGIWVKDIPQAWKALQKIKTASRIKLAIGRDNHRIQQIYSINR